MQTRLLRPFTSKLSDTAEALALPFTLLDLLKHDPSVFWVDMQIVIQFFAEEVIEELLDASPVGLHILRP